MDEEAKDANKGRNKILSSMFEQLDGMSRIFEITDSDSGPKKHISNCFTSCGDGVPRYPPVLILAR